MPWGANSVLSGPCAPVKVIIHKEAKPPFSHMGLSPYLYMQEEYFSFINK